MDIQFHSPKREDINLLVQLGESTGIFESGESQILLGQTLIDLLDKKLPPDHQAIVLYHSSMIKGWAYFGQKEPGTWNLWWIGVDPTCIGQGYGKALLQFVEKTVKSSGACHLLIETSSDDRFARTRRFYDCQGYKVLRTEVDGYGTEEKIVYIKTL